MKDISTKTCGFWNLFCFIERSFYDSDFSESTDPKYEVDLEFSPNVFGPRFHLNVHKHRLFHYFEGEYSIVGKIVILKADAEGGVEIYLY